MKITNIQDISTVSAHPVKSFFVHMLTRDIELRDAILDLLDNCIDGIQRSETEKNLGKEKPYGNYWARINLSKSEFRIVDNCGGIPWQLHDYAFRLGRLPGEIPDGKRSIGTYGIGMKRAIFKIGSECEIKTHAKDASYKISITKEWIQDENKWDIDALPLSSNPVKGTSIVIKDLRNPVQKDFTSSAFIENFKEIIASHFAYIISKGFSVYLNEELIKPKNIKLLFVRSKDESSKNHPIEPFIFQAKHNGVDIFLAVGFTRDIPSEDEAKDSFFEYKEKYSAADAGWTIVCNDRVVLYCDKSALTGWGLSGVPQYHMQFIAISGIVVFSSDNPGLLPTTTTKRSIDAQSETFLLVKDKMIEGMKIFTSYTNSWKGKELVNQSRNEFRKTSVSNLSEIQERVSKIKLTQTRGVIEGKQYRPYLPKPNKNKTDEKIRFIKPIKEIKAVSKYLFDTVEKSPSEVGEKCFDLMFEEASK